MQDPVAPLCLCPPGTVPVPAPVSRGPPGGAGPCLPLFGLGGSSPRLRQRGPAAAPVLSCFLNGLVCCIPASVSSLPPLWATPGDGGGHCGPRGQIMEWEQNMELEGRIVAKNKQWCQP